MADFPYTKNSGNIRRLLEQVQSVGVPAKVNHKWLESIGLRSSNDRTLVGVLKFIGFIDGSGVPTETWTDYRNKSKAGLVLAQSMRASYSSLFAMYPDDAHKKDDQALTNFFTSNTTIGVQGIKAIVYTFKGLRDLADFESDVPAKIQEDVADVAAEKEKKKEAVKKIGMGGGMALTVNIQLQIPATDDASIYDKFFESLYKHVISKETE